MITTTKGPMDETLLRRVEGVFENEHELTRWIEYYDDGLEPIHRSVHVTLKQGIGVEAALGSIG